MNPLKVKASGSPITSANISGLQTMTNTEVKNYIANVITEKFAAVTDGTGTAEINITTDNSGSGTSIGNFVDTTRTEAIGTHPASGNTLTTTYYAKQVTASAAENITNRPLAWDSGLRQMSDSDIDGVMDLCIEAMVTESAYTAGQYRLQSTAPSGGTWVSRYTITDIALGGNTLTYLWQKTTASSSPDSDYTPLRAYNGSNCKQMTESEIEQMLPNFRNRIIETGVGTYKLQENAPVASGTWVQLGNSFTDTIEQVAPQNYAGNYTGNFTGNYTGNYGGVSNYSGTYSGNFSSTVNYTSNYSGNYAGNYAGTGTFVGFYTSGGTFAGPTYTAPLGPLIGYSGSYTGSPFYSAFYTGPGPSYSGNYVRYYSGSRNYAGNYIGYYAGIGYYSGSRNYAGNYAGSYAGDYAGTINYSGPGTAYSGYYMADSYAGYYAGPGGNYLGIYTSYFTGNYVGAASYTGGSFSTMQPGFPEPFTAFYTGFYTGAPQNYSGSYLGFFGGFFSGPGPAYTGYYQAQQFIPGIGNLPAFYTGYYAGPGGNFVGNINYTGYYTGFYAGSRNYAGNYAGPGANYTGFYSGSRNYAGTYLAFFTGFYSGLVGYQGTPYGTTYTGNYNGFVPPVPYTGYYSGPGGTYTGYYTGPANYTGNYTGFYSSNFSTTVNYTGNFTGNYSGGGSYTGTYSGNFINNFSGNYSGATIQATKDTVSTIKLWIRTN